MERGNKRGKGFLEESEKDESIEDESKDVVSEVDEEEEDDDDQMEDQSYEHETRKRGVMSNEVSLGGDQEEDELDSS